LQQQLSEQLLQIESFNNVEVSVTSWYD